MIDVTIQQFGRSLVALSLGAAKVQAQQKKALNDIIEQRREERFRRIQEVNTFEEVSFNLTSKMIDKRFSSSKQFMETGASDRLVFKKTVSEEQKGALQALNKQTLKAKARYNIAAESYNTAMQNVKVQAAFKNINIGGQ
jgi:citrate lyase gamma subunit